MKIYFGGVVTRIILLLSVVVNLYVVIYYCFYLSIPTFLNQKGIQNWQINNNNNCR